MDIKKQAREVIRIEADALRAMADRLDDNFDRAVESILQCEGRVIVTGMGKSGLIGRKIAATFNSTGISSFFLHPAEALHGDLGLIRSEDILMAISKSGQLQEIGEIVAAVRRLGVKIIVLAGTVGSPLYQSADIALDCSVDKEACPNNLVPTSSSTAALVMGDALAVALLEARNFSAEDFAGFHPAGALGHRLLKHVSELHHSGDEIPLVSADATVSDMIVEMTGKRLGCVMVKNDNGSVGGIFTDGDLRRLIAAGLKTGGLEQRAADVILRNPKVVRQDALLEAALAIMEKHSITVLPTIDADKRLTGVIHLHDILRSKLV
ncbi:MAG: KpsF/GutQ family sugar-phosphate isomerase [candidate division Zixibacteria bacterium]|nr:KpsF/GutQ family sugar-phosphate isomerase [candidate division Zixibacteria bacterium]